MQNFTDLGNINKQKITNHFGHFYDFHFNKKTEIRELFRKITMARDVLF